LRQIAFMKKFLSTSYSEFLFNLGTLLLRLTTGILVCMNHGIPKITHFADWKSSFYNFAHIGSRWSLILSILAEVFASMFLILGLFSRFAALLLVIDLGVVVLIYHAPHPVSRFEDAIGFFAMTLFLLMMGPGKYSVDGLTGR
jgi:putative oxidoreductase